MAFNFLLNSVKKYIQDKGLIKYREKVLIACSGGADSVCLTEVLRTLAPLFSWQIFVGHVNHKIRGTQSQDDALWVSDFCRVRGLPLVVREADAPAFAQENGYSLEEAARIVRYRALEDIAKENGISVIAVAHHQEDNAETILMNILRGSGMDGLSGIKTRRSNIVRPFLAVPKREIEDFCLQNQLSYRTDSSNADKKYLRNQIRLELLPVLKQYNPEVVAALSRMGEALSQDADFLAKLARGKYQEALSLRADGLNLSLDVIKDLEIALLARVVLLAAKECLRDTPHTYINYQHVSDLINLVKNERTGAVLELPGGLKVKKDYVALCFLTGMFADQANALVGEYTLPVPGRLALPDKRIIRASIFRGKRPYPSGKHKAVFPASVAKDALIVRGRQAGDMFQPSGMNGSKQKLKEFFIDNKIPQSERDHIPLVLDKEGILWIAGVRGAHRREDAETDKWLYLELLDKEYINV